MLSINQLYKFIIDVAYLVGEDLAVGTYWPIFVFGDKKHTCLSVLGLVWYAGIRVELTVTHI